MKRTLLLTVLAVCIGSCVVNAIPANGFGITIGAGIAGSLSFFEVGVMLPKINDKVFVDIKLRWMSSITWVTFVNMETSGSTLTTPDPEWRSEG
jgi:hypothetical protein